MVANEYALLKSAGHDAQLYSVSNDTITAMGAKTRTFIETPYSPKSKQNLAAKIAAFRPDVVHVHNFFPLLTPSIYDACLEADVPVIQTLHNYRTICPGALLMRKDTVCEKCVRGSPYWGAWHRCYRNSLPGSLAVARMVDLHRKQGTWRTKVDCFIALTDFARNKFIEAGFPSNRIVVKPNFATDPGKPEMGRQEGALFVGRLSEEKGLTTLIEAYGHLNYPLRIVGDGPLYKELKAAAPCHVQFVGRLNQNEVRQEMINAAFLVMPSVCYEGFPMTLVEAFSCGLPVIASRLGAMREIVEDGITGLHFTPGDPDDLAAKIRWAIEHPDELLEMGCAARAEYERRYTPEENYRQLITIYEDAERHQSGS